MSNRTKSFFEQNNNKNTRKPLAEIDSKSNNTSASKPPIPPTSQAKAKLKAFQFIPNHPDGLGSADGKENEAHAQCEGTTNALQEDNSVNLAGAIAPGHQSSKEHERIAPVPQMLHANTFPSTPATRLPLEDLIGNYNEKRAAPQNESPEEFIGWIPNSSSALLTPNRKRKRARSSSPSSCPNTSSQRQETSAFFTGTAAQTEKKTPEADPSADLWQRYDNRTLAEDATLPGLGHLMVQASPHSWETPAKPAGFRRWASTGNEWPTSKSKRRRTHDNTGIKRPQDADHTDSGEKSKFANMLQKVEESLATQRLAKERSNPTVRIDGPSSSSPLPEVGAPDAFVDAPVASPLEIRHDPSVPQPPKNPLRAGPNASLKPRQHLPAHDRHVAANDTTRPPAPPNDSIISAPLCLQSKAPLPAYKRPSITRTPSNVTAQQQKIHVPAASGPLTKEMEDEFGDDFELSAEDLEELANQPMQRPVHQTSQQPTPLSQEQCPGFDQHHVHGQGASKIEPAAQPNKTDDFNDNSDEFGICDIDEAAFAAAEVNATQAFRVSPNKCKAGLKPQRPSLTSLKAKSSAVINGGPGKLRRYTVKHVVEGEYTNSKGFRGTEKVLRVEEERTLKTNAITLRDSWVSTPVSVGHVLHIADLRQTTSSEASALGQITISDAEASPLLIVHPNHMLAATAVATSFDCIRRALLQDRIKATGETGKPMVYGKILHEIFQKALSANQWDEAFLLELVQLVVQDHVQSLWELGMKDTLLTVEEISSRMSELASWARIFVAETPSEVALVDDKKGGKIRMSISKLIAIEEHIWSPQYGLKGNIDATVQTTTIDQPMEPGKKLAVPFEVKTGRTTHSPNHQAQTALYTLLLSDRYDISVQAGILYYLESSAMARIAPPAIEIRQMIQQRNRLAAYLHQAKHPTVHREAQPSEPRSQDIEESGLPGLLKNPFKCGRCYAQQSCFTYHALVENGSAESAGMIDDGKKDHALVWQEVIGHLELSSTKSRPEAEKLKQWFTKWDRLLTFEEMDLSRLRKEIWTMDSAEREAAGRCFGNLIIDQDFTTQTAATAPSSLLDGVEGSGEKINRFAYSFVSAQRKPGHSFAQGTQLIVGEPVVVSSENGQWALAVGYVVAATKRDITVAVDRKLGNARARLPNFEGERNQAFKGIMTVGDADNSAAHQTGPPNLYRLDKDEFANGLALVRNNLVTLMSSHPIHTKLRGQVILGNKPAFSSTQAAPQMPPSQLGRMNEDQTAAIQKVLSAQDYALILGMPGTGKTTTIAHVIRALLIEQKSILLTSFTHTAVDNVLLKIRDIAPPNSILRLGPLTKINSQVQEFCQLASMPYKTIDEVERAYMGTQIVATTCMGTNHALFNRRAFDVCIVDEASQITLPTSLGPLLHARKFVLVGDHYQLPPLVQNIIALENGLDVSLFRQLSEEHPESIAKLGKQYRMCEEIMSLPNALIYDGQLRCGNDNVAQRTLKLESLDGLATYHAAPRSCTSLSAGAMCWIERLVRPQHKVIFANTDTVGQAAHETLTIGKNITNQLEATLVAQVVLSLLALGVPGSDIGVITLYRSQVALIRQLFRRAEIGPEVEIDSADRFQGRDKECIILSMVRSNEAGIVGDLLKDWRRVNVALTRARSKLIVLGSRQTLRNNDLLAKFLSLVDTQGWGMNLPSDVDVCHTFDFSSQAASDLITQSISSHRNARDGLSATPPKAAVTAPTVASKSPREALRESPSASNRDLTKIRLLKQPAKVISGNRSQASPASKKAMELAVFEIFEDLTAENL